jgi:hypothetical protein
MAILRDRLSKKKVPMEADTNRERWIALRQIFTKDVDAEFFGTEFDRLMADRRVARMVVTEREGIQLTTVPVMRRLQGDTVYLGTYQVIVHRLYLSVIEDVLDFRPSMTFKVHCINSGRYDGRVQATYPNNAKHLFCFGIREKYLEELANEGEFYTFFNVMLDSLWHINPLDIPKIHIEFWKVLPDKSLEPCKDQYQQGNSNDDGFGYDSEG